MKKLMLICAPVSSRSGYGDHARDLVRSFIEHDKYNVKILDVPWGECPRNALDGNNINDKKIIDCILSEPKMDSQPDVYVDIRIPNEFQTYGKINIGITAGIETNAVSPSLSEFAALGLTIMSLSTTTSRVPSEQVLTFPLNDDVSPKKPATNGEDGPL